MQVDIVTVHGLGESDDAWVYTYKRIPKKISDLPGKRRGSGSKTDRKGQTQSKADGATPREAAGGQRVDPALNSAAVGDFHLPEHGQPSRDRSIYGLEGGRQPEKLTPVPEDGLHPVPASNVNRSAESIGPKNENKTTLQVDPSRIAAGLTDGPNPPQDQDKAGEDTGAHNAPDSSRQSADYSRRQDGQVHWLKDADMLPRAIPNARILLYSYQDPPNINTSRSGQSYLENTAKDLIKRIQNYRSPEKKFENVPIIFVCHGFGGMIVLKAMELIDQACKPSKVDSKDTKDASKQNEDASKEVKNALPIAIATAGIMLLEAPPFSSLTAPWMRSWMRTTALFSLNTLQTFFHEKHGKGICTAWFHDQQAIQVKVCPPF